MEQIRKVLASTDLSEFSKIGIYYALTLAKAVDAEVMVFHVVDYEDPVDYDSFIKDTKIMKSNPFDEGITRVLPRVVKTAFEHYGEIRAARSYYAPVGSVEGAKAALRQFLQDNFWDLLPGINVREEVVLGSRERIVEKAKKQATDLIVMSTHGRSAVAQVFRGSVTEYVIRNATCPVVAIGPESIEKMRQKLGVAVLGNCRSQQANSKSPMKGETCNDSVTGLHSCGRR